MSKDLIQDEDYQIVTPAENGLFTVSTLNTNSPSNSGLLEDYQNVDSIPEIPISTNSCFDPNNLPIIPTLDELLSYLCELMIRFDGCVKDYQKSDYEHLIKTISNSLIYLYQNNQIDLNDLVNQVNNKVDKVVGKTLTTNDLTDLLKAYYDIAYTHSQSDHAPIDAEKNVQADWNAESGPSAILNKPTNIGGGIFENNIIVSLPDGKTLGK